MSKLKDRLDRHEKNIQEIAKSLYEGEDFKTDGTDSGSEQKDGSFAREDEWNI